MKRLVAQLAVVIAALVMAVPASADDGQIAKKIIDKLNQHKQASSLRGFDLGVQVDKGTVTMMGQVASSEQAMLALDVARRIPGVKLVVNDLYVDDSAAATPKAKKAAKQSVKVAATQPTAVGSSVAHPQSQRPVAIGQSNIRQASAQQPIQQTSHFGHVHPQPTGSTIYAGAVSGSPAMPAHAWPSYAASPNYAAVTYPQQYSATAWPYIGPFYPYPQVPLGWRKVSLEWDDGWWYLDFSSK